MEVALKHEPAIHRIYTHEIPVFVDDQQSPNVAATVNELHNGEGSDIYRRASLSPTYLRDVREFEKAIVAKVFDGYKRLTRESAMYFPPRQSKFIKYAKYIDISVILGRALSLALQKVHPQREKPVHATISLGYTPPRRELDDRPFARNYKLLVMTTLLTLPFKLIKNHALTIAALVDNSSIKLSALNLVDFAAAYSHGIVTSYEEGDVLPEDDPRRAHLQRTPEEKIAHLMQILLNNGRLDTVIYFCYAQPGSKIHAIIAYLIQNVTKTLQLVPEEYRFQIPILNDFFEEHKVNRLYFPDSRTDPQQRIMIPRDSIELSIMEDLVRQGKYRLLGARPSDL